MRELASRRAQGRGDQPGRGAASGFDISRIAMELRGRKDVAVNGLAYGGGCEITEAAHFVIASDCATFAKPEINLGMPPTFGGTQRLPRLVGRKRALEFLLTGSRFQRREPWRSA